MTREHGGIGLGLYNSRRSARAIGGDVSVEPSQEGTTFMVKLPLTDTWVESQADLQAEEVL